MPAAATLVAISAYLGTTDTFDAAVADFAETYADQNARDHAAYVTAINDGQVSSQPEDLQHRGSIVVGPR